MRRRAPYWNEPFYKHLVMATVGPCCRSLYGRYTTGFNLQPDPLGRALHAARQAADAAPSNALAHIALARARFFRKEFQAFRTAADQAIALNPLDGGSLASMGLLMAYAGEWEHGCAMVERAAQRNPHHPGWYWFPFFYNVIAKATTTAR